MALTKTAPPVSAGPVSDATVIGGFEEMDNPTEAANETPAAAPQQEAKAPAVAPTRAVAVTPSKAEATAFQKEVEEMKGAADFTYGNYLEFKGNNGEINNKSQKISFGRWVKVSMIAWDNHFEVSPNSKADKSRDAVGYSKDGVIIDHVIGKEYTEWNGQKVADYLSFMRTELGYKDADSREFIDVACVVHESEKGDTLAGEIVKIVLSQSSMPSFSQYQEKLKQKARAVARGIPGVVVPADPFTFYFVRELASSNGNDWTKLAVHDKLPPL